MAISKDNQAKAALALRDLASGLYTVDAATSLAQKPLNVLQYKLKSIETLEKNRAELEQGATKLQKIAKVFEKVGPTKAAGKIAEKVADRTKKKLDKIEDKLDEITEVTDKIATVVEKTNFVLGRVSSTTEKLGILADVYSRKLAVADQNLAKADQLFQTGISLYDETENLKDGLKIQLAVAAEKNSRASADIAAVVAIVCQLEENIDGLSGLTDYDGFDILDKAKEVMDTVADVLSPLFAPLSAVYDAVGPVIDALGSIFGWLLAPAEWALDAILEATGINDLLNDAADEILSFLPNLDILDGLAERLEIEILADLEAYLSDMIEAPFARIQNLLNNAAFPLELSAPTSGDDALFGGMNDDGPRDENAGAGNDIVVGGGYDDTLRGGTGRDLLIGAGGDDLLIGGDDTIGSIDMAIYDGSINDYGIVSKLENGQRTGIWFVVDYRDKSLIEGTSIQINTGTDRLEGIEAIVFEDEVLDLRNIATFIRTQTADGEYARVTPTESTLPDIAGQPVITADRDNDRILGALGYDVLITGGGNDLIYSGSNGPKTANIQNAVGDNLQGGADNDTYIIGQYGGGLDYIFDTSGVDNVDYSQSAYGLKVFLGGTTGELLYRPTSITFDADPVGRVLAGNVLPVGVLYGIENIDGTEFDDVFIGSDAINKIKGRDGDDQIRGLDGDDILLGGGGSDTLIGDGGDDFLDGGAGSNSYIGGLGNDYISDLASTFSTVKYAVETRTDKYNQDVDFVDFLITGGGATGNPYDMPGGIVILPTETPYQQQVSKYHTSVLRGDRYGVDYLEGIEIIVGSIGRDIIHSARDVSQIIYGGTGSDDLFSGVGDTQNTFYAGPGDDFFVSDSLAEDTFFGGSGSDTVRIWGDNTVEGDLLFGDDNRQTPLEGTDVLDMSQSDFSWHVYMNPNAPNGEFVGKFAQASIYTQDLLFIQPTEGVNGVVRKQSGSSVAGERYPDVNRDLITADPNTENPGGEARNMGEFEHIIGSENRDIISGGNPDAGVHIEGLGGDDVLYAAQVYGATLSGGAGDDVLGTYNHTLGNDTPVAFFDASQRTIMDGGLGNDTFVAGDFREEISGGDGLDRLTYEVSTDGVTVDLSARILDGGYATGDILIGGIEDVTGSQEDDSLTGDDGRNVLVGWHGDDTLAGGDGADVLYGNAGADRLFGGLGNDLLHGGVGGDLLDGGAGADAASWNLYQEDPKGGVSRLTGVQTGVNADLATGAAGDDTLVGIENLVGGVGNDTFYGDSIGNLLSGSLGDDLLVGRGGNDLLSGGVGDDTLRGEADDDYLSGGAGTNEIDGGAGWDTLDYSILTYGIEVTMAGVSIRAGEARGQVLSFVPEDMYVWSDSVQTVQGPTGRPEDTIETGTSETRFTYERRDQGTDDPSDDVVIQREAITPERIWKLDPFFATASSDLDPIAFLPDTLRPEQQVTAVESFTRATDYFENVEVIVGSQGDDSILGNAENTEFNGGTGADTITGGEGMDTASYLFSASAVTIDLGAREAFGGDADGDVLTEIENISGSAFDDRLTGDDGANRLFGAGGSDTVIGGAGIDTVAFDVASTDVIVARTQTGVRIIVEMDGVILTDDHVADDVEVFDFTDRSLSRTELAGLIIAGTDESEEIVGTAIADYLRAGGGNDTVFGLRGSDEIYGDGGADTLLGEDGNDTIYGGDGADTLNGGTGADILTGGAGRDQFIGGTGNDVFVLNDATEIVTEAADEGSDTVRASVSDTLQANVEGLELTGSANLQGTGNTLNNLMTGNAGANLLRGLGGADRLDGGEGIDTLEGGAGDDTYVSRDGLDTIIETANGGRDKLESWISAGLGGNLEDLSLMGTDDLEGTGTTQANEIAGNAGDNTIDARAGDDTLIGSLGDDTLRGGDGTDLVVYSFERAAARFDFDDPNFILVYKPDGIDRLEGIDHFRFADGDISTDALRLEVLPEQDVQLYAASYYENDYAIDMSREGGGAQFLNIGPASQGSNRNNEFHFTTAFADDGGRAMFGGQNINNLARATVNNFKVDFSGGNTTMMSVFGFVKPLLDILDAPWGYWETNIFNGDDRVVGSYFGDTLVGFAGDDTIFGGLGDKEQYDISDTSKIPSPRPSTIRQAGRVADRAEYLVHDGDDLIDGEGGNDLLDGGTGNDTILGGAGDDQLWGGGVSGDKRADSDPEALRDTGADQLDGGTGDDTLDGGGGNDTMTGGEGDDVFVVTMGMGQSTITDFGLGNDTIDFSKLTSAQQADVSDEMQSDGTRLITLSDGSTLTITMDSGNRAATGVVAIVGTAVQGGDLLADVSELSDPDGIGTLTFQWNRDGMAIDGATSETYRMQQADVGRELTVTVGYTDNANFAEMIDSLPTEPVKNINDPLSGLVQIDGIALVGRVLSANIDGLSDPDGLGRMQYQWARGGVDVTSAQGQTYEVGVSDLGAVMSVRVSYVDNFSSSETSTGAMTERVVATRTLGTEGNDSIGGTTGEDYIAAAGGNDKVAGGGGADELSGGVGDDYVFGDGFQGRYSLSEANQVYRLYQATLDRAPDAFGHAYWAGQLYTKHLDLSSVVKGFTNSLEFTRTYGALNDSDFVTLLYANVLGRTPDAGGLTGWLNALEQGTERSKVVLGFSDSPEFTQSTKADANLFAFVSNPAGWSDDIYRLYRATLDREPDAASFAGWARILSTEKSYENVISGFVGSAEFKATYGSLDDAAFVGLLYNNVLDRDPDVSGLNGWLETLDDGVSRETVVKGFAQSAEFAVKTAAPLAEWMRDLGVDDIVDGGAGSNTLAGGVNADTFLFKQADTGSHKVLDLEPWDYLSFDGFGFESSEQALTHFSQDQGHVVFSNQGTMITLINTQLADLNADMIML